ncbi:PE family protein [Mycobacterium sp.]|uniref:PE family protein n=1 Tax=Mycobacterium sp. TaxID=1785 RepID=UPI003F9501B8
MTYVTTEPQLMSSVAADIDRIGSAISSANVAAAGPTSELLAPAADQISTAITKLFGLYSREYQAVAAQAAVFHRQFAQALAAAGGAYAAAEEAAQSLVGGGTAASGGTAFVDPPNPLASPTVALVMGGTGNPLPNATFVNGVLNWATLSGYSWNTTQAVFTPEQLYPLTGPKTLPLSTSVSQGVQMLDAAIKQQIASGNSVLVQGYSQSAVVASLEMRNLAAAGNPYSTSQLAFNLLGDPMNPNGGLLARFPGLSFPSIGLDFYGATPANTPYQTTIYTLEYDGFADFPRYPIDLLADLNAVAGIAYVHPNYSHLDPATLPPGDIVKLDTPGYTGNTTYYMVLTPDLPLLDPVRAIPLIGNPLADLLQPDLTYLVNWGYGNPAYGYSTSPANVPTTFGLFPHVNPGVLAGDLITGTQQGISSAAADLMTEGLAFPSGGSLSGMANLLSSASLPSLATLLSPSSVDGFIQSLEVANTNVFDAISSATSTGYSLLLPTADIINTVATTIPSYDVNLFLNGIAQAAGGDPVGLLNAVGGPLAADTGLLTVAGGIEGLVLLYGAAGVVTDLSTL